MARQYRQNPARFSGTLEILEPRALLAAAVNENFFAMKVDFRPESAAQTLMRGYRADLGRVYGVRANGFTYGWNEDQSSNMRERNSDLSPDDRYDTIAKMPAGATWSVAVPSGWYDVRIFGGDARNWENSEYIIDVEGSLTVNAKPVESRRFVEGVITTHVSDGKLSVLSDVEGTRNAISFVHIQQIRPPTDLQIVNDLDWKTSASLRSPVGRVEAGVVRAGGDLYVMGGYVNGYGTVTGRVDVLNIETGAWRRGKSLPGAQTHFGAATDGRFIYAVAGQYGALYSLEVSREAWKYDPAKNRWTRWIDLPEDRFGGALAYLDNALYFYGGTESDRVSSSATAWKIDFKETNPRWRRIADMPYVSDHLGHAVLGGEIYAVGGEREHNVSYIQHRDMYSYNPKTNIWRQRASMPTPSSHFEGAITAYGGKLWVVAGQINAQQLTDEVRSYDPITDQWSVHTPFPERRKGGATWIADGKLFYTTGDSLNNGQPRTVLFSELPI